MLPTPRIHRLTLLILAVTPLAGCELLEDPFVEGPDQSRIEFSEFETALAGATASLDPITSALAIVEEARAALQADGAVIGSLAVNPALRAGAAGPRLGVEVSFPLNVAGSTYVRDPSTRAFERDAERSDAPAGGVRLMRYRRHENGEFLIPLAEFGAIDLLDEDAEAEERLGVLVREGEGTVVDIYVAGRGDNTEERARRLEGQVTGATEDITISIWSSDTQYGSDFQAFIQGEQHPMLEVYFQSYRDADHQEGSLTVTVGATRADDPAFLQTLTFNAWFQGVGENAELSGDGFAGGFDFGIDGTLGAPTFTALEGSGLDAADRQAIERLWAAGRAFIAEWLVPLGS